MCESDKRVRLPHSFDLHCDLKYYDQLERGYAELKKECEWAVHQKETLETLCKEYNIPLKD